MKQQDYHRHASGQYTVMAIFHLAIFKYLIVSPPYVLYLVFTFLLDFSFPGTLRKGKSYVQLRLK